MMKSIYSLLIVFTAFSASLFAQNSAPLVESFPLGTFDKVEASSGVNVTVTEDKEEKLVVEIKNGVPSDVTYEIKGMTLLVKMKNRIGKGVVVNVTVHYKTLVALAASMGATIDNEGILYADHLKLAVSSDASMELKVDAKAIEATSSIGKITLSGDVEYQEVSCSAGGQYLASDLESKQALAKSSSGATIEINVTEKVESKATFGGTITVTGDPKSTKWEENSGGKVSPH